MTKDNIKQAASQLFNSDDVQTALDELKFGNRYETSISIFDQRNLQLNLDISVIKEMIKYLNQEHAEYIFKLGRGLGSPMLYIADKEIKLQNPQTHATKTMQDLEAKLNELGVQTDLLYHVDPDTLLSDEEFEKYLSFYKSCLK